MGRKPKVIEVEYTDDNDNREGLDLDAIFENSGGDTGAEIVGRVYRVNGPKDSLGRPQYEAVAKVNKVVDEDWLGRNFGGGTYHIKYNIIKDGQKAQRQLNYYVGEEYNKFVKPDESTAAPSDPTARHGALDVGGLLGSLTVDKVAAIAAAVKAVKEIFAPPPPPPTPQIDFVRLLEVLNNNNKPSVSEAIVIESLKSMKQQQERPQSSIAQQIADYNALKEIFDNNNNNEDDAEGGDMGFILDKAFQYLPMLLKANNNNYQAVGQQARENPMVNDLIMNNPDLAQKFFERAKETYGIDNAKALAAGFNYKMDVIPQQQSEGVTNENN